MVRVRGAEAWGSDTVVADGADALDPGFEHVAGAQEPRWLSGDADPGGCTGEDDVTREEGQDGRKAGDELRDAEDEVTGTGILHLLTIDRTAQGEVVGIR